MEYSKKKEAMGVDRRYVGRPYYSEILDAIIEAHPDGIVSKDIQKNIPNLTTQHIGMICKGLCWSGVISEETVRSDKGTYVKKWKLR